MKLISFFRVKKPTKNDTGKSEETLEKKKGLWSAVKIQAKFFLHRLMTECETITPEI